MIVPIGHKAHRANVAICTDGGSLAHLLAGFISGLLPHPFSLGAFALFTGYQVSQHQSGASWSRTGGEFIEFGLGAMASSVLMRRAA